MLKHATICFRSVLLPALLLACSSGITPHALLAGDDRPPATSNSEFKVANGLTWTRILEEPTVRQPLFVTFDERGRLWVLQYLQYPDPAGLKMLSRDNYWRAVYDRIPEPPPRGVRGEDKITIHEDTDGDGTYDKHGTFIDGLNIATSFAFGRGGVWVLNPPYLLFYPDTDQNDVPDGDPEVHLAGFGLEDTHSCVNSLCWGPDGWLYAAQGSTVTGRVTRPGFDDPAVVSLGQNIWRYHPETRTYEIFAEGGGNAFGVEIDSRGRVFSGHNGGDTRGFAYVQGGYFQKGFNKHGPLSNPYSFGYFPMMKHNQTPRFTHAFLIYEGNTFPPEFAGKLFGVAPLLHHVVTSEMFADGSSVQTRDIGHAITTTDLQFTPVDVKLGPDGGVYVADWYDRQCAHTRNYQGEIDKSNGRIYRLQGEGVAPSKAENLGALSTAELLSRLAHPNRWHRSTALRLLYDRRDTTAIPLSAAELARRTDVDAVPFLWSLYASGGLTERAAQTLLRHPSPDVRRWVVRLVCDRRYVEPPLADALVELAKTEPAIEVRSQLASSARRLPVEACTAMVRQLVTHSSDADDIHLPLLLWWALEAHCAKSPDAVIAMFGDPAIWDLPLVSRHLTSRLMRRFAQSGRQEDWTRCVALLKLSPSTTHTELLLDGFEAGVSGRTLPELPEDLSAALQKRTKLSLPLGIRRGDAASIQSALQLIGDESAEIDKRLELIRVFGDVDCPAAVPVLTGRATTDLNPSMRMTALASLRRYSPEGLAEKLISRLARVELEERGAVVEALATRKTWALELLAALEADRVPTSVVSEEIARPLTRYRDSAVRDRVLKLWPGLSPQTNDAALAEIERLAVLIRSGSGSPKQGRPLWEATCAKCHKLFGTGAEVGPDLTSYQRDQLESVLLAVVHPSAEIREGYAALVAATNDGRVITGILVEQDAYRVVLRGSDALDVSLPRDSIEELTASPESIMPEGLLRGLTDEQIVHLFAYIRMTQPLID
jgi:putative heme-binding domain-containing protein